jgi:membrane fusion protein (multidrug efflux system)
VSYRKLTWVIVGLGTAVLCGCSNNPASVATAAAATPTHNAAPAPAAVNYYETSGVLVVENQVDVQAQRDGMLSEILVDTGSRVQKGQLLARIDDRQLQADREAADAKIRSIEADLKTWEADAQVLQSDYERDQEMFKAQLITEKQLDHSHYKMIGSGFQLERERQNVRNAKATLQSLDLEIEKTRIVAPFTGVVARRYIRSGQKIAPNDRLFWVTATSPVNVQFTLPESFRGKITTAQEITVLSPLTPKESHIAKVKLVSPVVDPASGTIEVLAELMDNSDQMMPGTSALVRVAKPK